MKILVCMKQVPAGTKVDIDPETGAMKRLSGETRTNPYDLFALEAALQLREKVGGSVTVLTMGPPQAEEMMRDAYTMGADDAVILSDRKFAGADVLATSYALSQGITAIGDIDLIICGKRLLPNQNAYCSYRIHFLILLPYSRYFQQLYIDQEPVIFYMPLRFLLFCPCFLLSNYTKPSIQICDLKIFVKTIIKFIQRINRMIFCPSSGNKPDLISS